MWNGGYDRVFEHSTEWDKDREFGNTNGRSLGLR